MRRIFSVLVVVALAFVLAGTTQAATFVPEESSLTLNLGSIYVGGFLTTEVGGNDFFLAKYTPQY